MNQQTNLIFSNRLTNFLISCLLVVTLLFYFSHRVQADSCSGQTSRSYSEYDCRWNDLANKYKCITTFSGTDSKSCGFYPGFNSCSTVGICGACLGCGQICSDGTATEFCNISAEQCGGGGCSANSVWTNSGCSCNISTLPTSTPVPDQPSPTTESTPPPPSCTTGSCILAGAECGNPGTGSCETSPGVAGQCCILGESCSNCQKSNPYDPDDIYHGDYGEPGLSMCNSGYLPNHYRTLTSDNALLDANCAERFGSGFDKTDICCGPLWSTPTPTPTSIPPTITPIPPTVIPTPTCAVIPAPELTLSAGGNSQWVSGSVCNQASNVLCTDDTQPTWSWTNTSPSNYCAATYTSLYTWPPAPGVWYDTWRSGVVLSYTPAVQIDNQCYLSTVRFVNPGGTGPFPALQTAKIDSSAPTAPTNLNISCTLFQKPIVTWTAPADIGCASLNATAAFAGNLARNTAYDDPLGVISQNTTSYTYAGSGADNSQPGTVWYARVLAKDIFNRVSGYITTSVTCPNCTISNLSCPTPTSNSVNLTYTTNNQTGAGDGVAIFRNSGATPIGTTSLTANTYADTGLAYNTNYTYDIACYKAVSGSTYYFTHSNSVTCRTPAPPPYSCTISPQNETVDGSERLPLSQTFTCTGCSDLATSYFVWSNPPSGYWETAPAVSAPSVDWIAPNVAGTYRITGKVYDQNNVEKTTCSTDVTVYIPPAPTPTPSCDTVASAPPNISNDLINGNLLFSWDWTTDYSCSSCSSTTQCTNTYNCEGPVSYCANGAPSGDFWSGCGTGCATGYVYYYEIYDDGNLIDDGYASLGSSYSVGCDGKDGHEITAQVKAIDARGNLSIFASSTATCRTDCAYSLWADDACGGGTACTATQMHQVRTLSSGDPLICSDDLEQCVADASCGPTPPVDPTVTPISSPTPTTAPVEVRGYVYYDANHNGVIDCTGPWGSRIGPECTWNENDSWKWTITISGVGSTDSIWGGYYIKSPVSSGNRTVSITPKSGQTQDRTYYYLSDQFVPITVAGTHVTVYFEVTDRTFCGDGLLQTPNDTGTGGPLNDGVEECDGGTNCDMTGYGCILINDSWWQTYGGLIYAQNAINSSVSSSATSGSYLILENLISLLNSAGIPLTSNNSILTGNGLYTQRLEQASVQSANYTQVVRQDYDYFARFYNLAEVPEMEVSTVSDFFNITFATIDAGTINETNIYRSDEDLTIDLDGTWSPGGKNIVFVNGNINFLDTNSDLTSITSLNTSEFIAFIASGTITFDSTIGYADPTADPALVAPNLAGLFVADKIVISSNSGTDRKFIGEGTFVGWDSFELGRDFNSSANSYDPTEVFIYRPDLVLSAPERIKQPISIWQEIL